jgi:hypothetical protein
MLLFSLLVVLNLVSCKNQETNVNRIDLAGEWDFQIDSLDQGIEEKWFEAKLSDKINLPGSMTTNGKGTPQTKDKIRYTYDFGDDWVHDIMVEKVLDRDPSAAYPRCTGGKRAAPPDDCGGIWGYAELLEVLADPAHPEHEEQLQWLGLADASQFTPDTFDMEAVNRLLGASGGARSR